MPAPGVAAALRAPLVLAMLLVAGCTSPAPAVEEPALRILALDGRWAFDPARAEALLVEAGAPPPVGRLLFVEALGRFAVADVVGVDEGAARALGVDVVQGARVAPAFAAASDVHAGDVLALRSWRFPTPYVATYFEMERTLSCERAPQAKLCFLPHEVPGEARLRLRVDPGARDLAFLPDLVELGPSARPAYWNGSFVGPDGSREPFQAHASLEGALVPALRDGELAAGEWEVRFRLEARGVLAAAGAAGIVRVREPGHLWFDDRLTEVPDAAAQARAVLANATLHEASVEVGIVGDAPLGADIIVPLERAQDLAGTTGATALLVELTPSQERALSAAAGPDGVTAALRARALPTRAPSPPQTHTLVLAAPPDLDVAALPAVPGAGAPSLALAGRAPFGEPVEAGGAALPEALLLLAHAQGELPFHLPDGARWTRAEDALENLSRSRTLALASPDIVSNATATVRLDLGSGNATRSMVAIGGVAGGPSATLWTSAALVAGAGHPVAPRLVVPVDRGADEATVLARVLAAWGELGVVRAR